MDINVGNEYTQQKRQTSRISMALRIAAVVVALASIAFAVYVFQPPSDAVLFSSLSSPDEIKEDEVYLINDMLTAGIFMYMGDADQKGTPRKSTEGLFLEKEHVYAYHTLAMGECADGQKCLMVFSVKRTDGEIFDAVADHDKKENENGDPGDSFPVSVYVIAKKLNDDTAEAFTKSKAEHGDVEGMAAVNWAYYEMEYVCDAEEDYISIATGRKREWLRLSLCAVPLVISLIAFSFLKLGGKPEEAEDPAE